MDMVFVFGVHHVRPTLVTQMAIDVPSKNSTVRSLLATIFLVLVDAW